MRKNLRVARRKMRLSQRELASRIGISLGFYNLIENGKQTGGIWIWDKLEDLTGIPQRTLRDNSGEVTVEFESYKYNI